MKFKLFAFAILLSSLTIISLINRNSLLGSEIDDTNSQETLERYIPSLFETSSESSSTSNPIISENNEEGTNAWTIGNNPISSDKNNEIKGYANKTSVSKDEQIEFKVSVNPIQTFRMEIYRIGWYDGLGGRLLQSIGPQQGRKRAACPIESSTKLIECKWGTDHTLTVPSNWVSGVYLVKLINNKGFVNYIPFIVRDDTSRSDILLQLSTHTWHAYNKWGGYSLYPPGQNHAVKVSYDRPYQGNGSGQLLAREINFVRWIEKEGYDVSYTTNVDTHARGNLIKNHKAFISQGHDEYWTWEMRDAVENARDSGVNLAFFGGNESYWQIRQEPSLKGIDNRTIVGYKEQYKNDPFFKSSDPSKKRRTTSLFRYKFIDRPEQLMMGNMYGRNLAKREQPPFKTYNVNNWIYEGTNVEEGENLTNIIGKEYNNVKVGYPLPKNISFTIVGKSPDPYFGGFAEAVIYQAPSNAWVFSAGTMNWSWGLDDFGNHGTVSPVIQKMTKNILDKFIGKTVSPTPTLSPSPTFTPTPTSSPSAL